MKKLLLVFMFSALLFSSCADSKTLELNSKIRTFEPYGLIDKDEFKNDSIQYKLSVGNIVWSVILSETFVAPVYFIRFQLYEPVAVKPKFVNVKKYQ